MNNDFFYQFGEAATYNTKTPLNLFKDYSFYKSASENAIYDEQQIKIAKAFVSITSSILSAFSDEPNSPVIHHLNKIASEDVSMWNDHCEDVLDNCMQFFQENNISKEEFAKTAGIAELALRSAMFPAAYGSNLAAAAVPISGAAIGGLSYLAEKEINEDNVNNEILKAKIKEWQRLSAELNKELKERYGYSLEFNDSELEEDSSKEKQKSGDVPVKEVDE